MQGRGGKGHFGGGGEDGSNHSSQQEGVQTQAQGLSQCMEAQMWFLGRPYQVAIAVDRWRGLLKRQVPGQPTREVP